MGGAIMKLRFEKKILWLLLGCVLVATGFPPSSAAPADKLAGIHSALVMSQSMPWIAQEASLFPKYNLDFRLVYIASSGMVTAAMLGGDADISQKPEREEGVSWKPEITEVAAPPISKELKSVGPTS